MPEISAPRFATLDRAVDSETTGVDRHHGALPFFFTSCDSKGDQLFWCWDVDPLTRQPHIPKADIVAIKSLIKSTRNIVGQNLKFDVGMLGSLDEWFILNWPWAKTYDTLVAGHVLASNQPHDLTSAVLMYLGIDIEPLEKKVRAATIEARKIVQKRFPDWLIAKEGLTTKKGLPCMPSAKGNQQKGKGEKDKLWKYDMWLPRALALELNYPDDHPWFFVLPNYANADSATTLPLHEAMVAELEKKGLLEIYLKQLELPRILVSMESRGLTFNEYRRANLYKTYAEGSEKASRILKAIAKDFQYDLELPKSGNNGSLSTFIFGEEGLNLPVVAKTDKGNPAFDKNAVDIYLTTIPDTEPAHKFITTLKGKRSQDTANIALKSYDKFKVKWVPAFEGSIDPKTGRGWYVIHPSLNPTGTNTLRFSSSNPNGQNVSDKEDFNLRYCFGPAPGREWWSFDYQNIELRIPAYESGEEAMIELFEKPDEPPYFGSYHLMNASIIHPDEFWPLADIKGAFQETYKVLYKTIKNFGFAKQYQGGRATCDKAARKAGAYDAISNRLTKATALNAKWVNFANKHGYVETLPDKTVNPDRGYPMYCTRTKEGRILSTIPLSYHIQGTAMQCTRSAMPRCYDYTQELSAMDERGYYMIMQIHDELLFDFPKGQNGAADNYPKALRIKKLMEQSGDDIGIPLSVSIKYRPFSWDKDEKITLAA